MKQLTIFFFFLITSTKTLFGQNIDIEILKAINVERNKNLDDFFIAISFSAEYLHLLVPICLIFWGLIIKSSKFRNNGLFILIILTINGIISYLLKISFDRVRPFKAYDFIEKISVGGSSSFPSGHTISAITLALAVSLLFKNKYIQTLVFAWAILVGYSRMHCGVHYFTDVMAGATIGLMGTYLFYQLFRKKNWLI